ncbi:MAG: 3-hydroxyacyl-ACP dehydratase [Bacteroidetes bacterium]|nr:3-hydroxyacyl-ACP dehydratase [Bacteroidota bacterium]
MFPINGEKLEQLIPQKKPFVLISSLSSVTDKTCTTTFSFDADHVLCEDGKLSMAGLLENMAQTSGCKLGYEDYLNGKPPRIGFIGEIRDFVYTRLPIIGEELTTEITIENQVFGTVTVVSGRIMNAGNEIASCRMKVFFEPEPE